WPGGAIARTALEQWRARARHATLSCDDGLPADMSAMNSPVGVPRRAVRTENAVIPGPDGRIEGAVDSVDAAARAIAVVCHPHPLQQGTMQNKVVTTVARAFAQLGAHAVRFNCRGVGTSQGRH